MKLALLANRRSIHAVRWANAMAERGHDVHFLSMHGGDDVLHERVRFHSLFVPAPAGYFFNWLQLKIILRTIQPDILHTHFASGYGTLGRLSRFHPCMLSIWGSDIYDFPEKSTLHQKIVSANLSAADIVCSTSHVMARYARENYPKTGEISVIPFGIDTAGFGPRVSGKPDGLVTVGTIKSLASKYGIDILIRAFSIVKKELNDSASNLRLLIVGSGPDRGALAALVKRLDIDSVTTFVEHVPHTEVPDYFAELDVYVAVSRRESFGVAILEASASGLPVVVSNVGGLPEVVIDHETGFIVQCEDVSSTAAAILRLVKDPELRSRMGSAGREYVQQRYEWRRNVAEMESVYFKLLNQT